MTRQAITIEGSAPPVGPFSPAVMAQGLLFVSGQVAVDPESGKLFSGDAAAQTDLILRNITTVLAAAGKSLADVVRVGVFLTDMADYAAMNAAYRSHFEVPYPARTAVAVAALPLGAKVEIEVIAQ